MIAAEWYGVAYVVVLFVGVIAVATGERRRDREDGAPPRRWWNRREPCPRCGEAPCRGAGYSADGKSYSFTCAQQVSGRTLSELLADDGDD